MLGVLLASVSGMLIYGGVYRTAARLNMEKDGQRQGSAQSQNSNRQNSREDHEDLERKGYQGGVERGSGQSGDSFSKQSGNINLSGEAMAVTTDFLKIKSASGAEIVIENRAWAYAQEQGFTAHVGDLLELTGFFDGNGVFEVSWIANRTLDNEVQIRDEGGRPYWAGGNGWRGGQGGKAG
jgi:hypothetical protein